MKTEQVIGVVGGVGPQAGLDLQQKILEQTAAGSDQEHLPVITVSMPAKISDRTAFLRGETEENPADALAEQLLLLERAGATIAGIPCNTAHSPGILDRTLSILAEKNSAIRLIHMIDEVFFEIKSTSSHNRVGLLSTLGTYHSGVYERLSAADSIQLLVPDETVRKSVHDGIYHPEFGVKTIGPNPQAKQIFREAANHLKRSGAQAVILGCTEIPLVFPETSLSGMPLIDPTLILARALIREAAGQEKLKNKN